MSRIAGESSVKLTVAFQAPDLDAEEKDEEVQRLLSQMKQIDEIEIRLAAL